MSRLVALAVAGLLLPTVLVHLWIRGAAQELAAAEASAASQPVAAVAAAADVDYCTPELKKILRRVLASCGLAGGGAGRGCQPTQAKDVAALAGDDFNALFLPLADRAGIVQYESNSAALDEADTALIDAVFADRGGASWFFVVARSSPEGSVEHNRKLSQQRGEAVLEHLRTRFAEPDLEQEVGLLWLGEEFAQLADGFCDWRRSGDACTSQDLNRSAFVAWIDCRL